MTWPSDELQDFLAQAVAAGEELGVQCAVWQDGRMLAECACGWADAMASRAVTAETLFPVFSTGKALLSALALKLVAEGRLALDAPLHQYWPAFTGDRREEATIAHVLTHTTGMFCMPHADSADELADWPLMCSRLAAMRPAWQPGARTKYQALNYSWLLGEPIREATGLSLREALEEWVLGPLGISQGCRFGLTSDDAPRCAELVRASDLTPPPPPKPTFLNPTENLLLAASIRRATLPAFNGYASALSLCRFGAALLDAGRPFLPPALLMAAGELHRPDPLPARPGYWERFGYGFLVYEPPAPGMHLFGHGGYGGSEVLVCPELRLVYAITRNRLSDSRKTHDFIRRLIGLLPRPQER